MCALRVRRLGTSAIWPPPAIMFLLYYDTIIMTLRMGVSCEECVFSRAHSTVVHVVGVCVTVSSRVVCMVVCVAPPRPRAGRAPRARPAARARAHRKRHTRACQHARILSKFKLIRSAEKTYRYLPGSHSQGSDPDEFGAAVEMVAMTVPKAVTCQHDAETGVRGGRFVARGVSRGRGARGDEGRGGATGQ